VCLNPQVLSILIALLDHSTKTTVFCIHSINANITQVFSGDVISPSCPLSVNTKQSFVCCLRNITVHCSSWFIAISHHSNLASISNVPTIYNYTCLAIWLQLFGDLPVNTTDNGKTIFVMSSLSVASTLTKSNILSNQWCQLSYIAYS
jgi:hypothetical protein